MGTKGATENLNMQNWSSYQAVQFATPLQNMPKSVSEAAEVIKTACIQINTFQVSKSDINAEMQEKDYMGWVEDIFKENIIAF